MTTFTVTFDRIGRTHNPEPLTVTTHSLDPFDDLLEAVIAYALPYIKSRHCDVAIDTDPLNAMFPHDHEIRISAGFRNAGSGIARVHLANPTEGTTP